MERFLTFSAEARAGDKIEISATRIENHKEATVFLLTPEQYEQLLTTTSYQPISAMHKLTPQTLTHRFTIPTEGYWFIVFLRREVGGAAIRHIPYPAR